MPYLKPGETYRSRLETVLEEFRSVPANISSSATRERARDEASLLISLIHADAAEALVSATLGNVAEVETLSAEFVGSPYSYLYDDDIVRRALDGGGYGDPDVLLDRLQRAAAGRLNPGENKSAELVSVDDAVKSFDYATGGDNPADRARFIRDLVGAEPESAPHSFLPAGIARVRDSLAYDVKGGEMTPRLPGEQAPAVDLEPEVDFDEEIDVRADTLDEVGQPKDDEHLDYDDPELDDFRPRKEPGKPEGKPETAMSALKKKSSKKETKK